MTSIGEKRAQQRSVAEQLSALRDDLQTLHTAVTTLSREMPRAAHLSGTLADAISQAGALVDEARAAAGMRTHTGCGCGR